MIILTIGDTSRRLSSSAGVEEGWVTHHLRSGQLVASLHQLHDVLEQGSAALPTIRGVSGHALWTARG